MFEVRIFWILIEDSEGRNPTGNGDLKYLGYSMDSLGYYFLELNEFEIFDWI